MNPAAKRTCLAIILAAGEGTRMRSALPKVLHQLAGRPMLGHVLDRTGQAGAEAVAIVVGPGREDVAAEARRTIPGAEIFVQPERRGTAHAVLAAREAIARGYDDILVVFADTPLVQPQSFLAMRAVLAQGVSVVALGFQAQDPAGYGRFVMQGDELVEIVEHKDASAAQRQIGLCNAGLMALDGQTALALLDAIGNANSQQEFYLTDAVATARAKGLKARPVIAPESEVMGVNDRVQLAAAEALMQARLREAAMRAGVTMMDPASVTLAADTKFARDVTLEPHVFIGAGVAIGEGSTIHAFSHLEGATIGANVQVGPFARLRPGARLGEASKVGNFVEVKAADIGAGVKISHLSYIGDASIGAEANIGAGTITCNYDGFRKQHTHIGAGAFIGSNTALVAPVSIGAGAIVGAGSVITKDVNADALAVVRAKHLEIPGWAAAFRDKMRALKAKRS